MTYLMPDQRPHGRRQSRANTIFGEPAAHKPACIALGFVEFRRKTGAHNTSRPDQDRKSFLFYRNTFAWAMELKPLSEIIAPVVEVTSALIDPVHLGDVYDVLVA